VDVQRFYLTACLIVYLSPEKAVASIKAKPQQPRDVTIKQSRWHLAVASEVSACAVLAANDDPDIIADSFSLSLKCPVRSYVHCETFLTRASQLTYMRMVLPCKASTCVHVQCFDAASFLAMAEANPYFQCPHCSKIIDGETLVIDAFTADILGQVPSKYDSVVVDCEATWHTEDYKFGTSKKPDTFKAPVEVVEDLKPVRQGSKAVEILDSDDDEDYSTPPVSKSTASGGAAPSARVDRLPLLEPRPARLATSST
jgi:E3 SUMO-protein ligase PIAS1